MKKYLTRIISIVCIMIICIFGVLFLNNKSTQPNVDISKPIKKEEVETPKKLQEDKDNNIDRKVVVTIDNGPGEGDDRLILVNDKIIARVFVAEKIYDYKDFYVTIEKEDKEDGMIVIYKNLIVVDKYSGEKKTYELEKVEENVGVSIDKFDKEKGLITINTGITTYIFDMNSRTMTEKN